MILYSPLPFGLGEELWPIGLHCLVLNLLSFEDLVPLKIRHFYMGELIANLTEHFSHIFQLGLAFFDYVRVELDKPCPLHQAILNASTKLYLEKVDCPISSFSALF
jgi:hypothetical protein